MSPTEESLEVDVLAAAVDVQGFQEAITEVVNRQDSGGGGFPGGRHYKASRH